MSLTNKTLNGVLWQFAELILRRGIGIAVTFILAFFLNPDDFGLMAIMTIFIAVGTSLMQSGFREALIRLSLVNQSVLNSAFFANIILGIISYCILYFSAPVVANFYEEKDLTLLIQVTSLAIVISSFQSVPNAILSRAMNFRAQFGANFPAGIISGIAGVIAAVYGVGVWALVVQVIMHALISTTLFWRLSGWSPSFKIDVDALFVMYRFGYKLFLSSFIDIVFRNIYLLLIAKVFTTSIAGLYFFADSIKRLVVDQLVSSIQSVTYPALSKRQDDEGNLKNNYKKLIKITSLIMFPVLLFISVLSELIFEIFLPANWLEAADYLVLMCWAALLYPIHAINLNILKVKERSDIYLGLEIIKKTLVIFILSFTFNYGVEAIIVGQIFGSFLVYIPNAYFTKKMINYGYLEQLKDFVPTLLIGIIASIVGSMVVINSTEILPLFSLLLSGGIMITVYIILNYIFQYSLYKDILKVIAIYRGK